MSTETEVSLEPLLKQVQEARDVCARMSRAVKNVAKPLDDLARKDALKDVAAVIAAVAKLDKAEVPESPLKTSVNALLSTLKAHLAEEEKRLRFYFGRDLREAATRAGVAFAPLTTDPPEFRLGLFTLGVDGPRRVAVLRYARNDLVRVPLAADAILEALSKQHAQLEGKAFDATAFFEQLLAAYQIRLQRINQPFGTRVDIVDLLAEIAFVRQGAAFFEDPQKENFVSYSRVQLAYDLARLRRAGRLAHRGVRLGLGSATGGSTKQKSRVLYLEDERGNGQWYLSLRFSREGEPGDDA